MVEHVDSYVYLGINLDAEMSLRLFASHLYNRIKKFLLCQKLGGILTARPQVLCINRLYCLF